MDAAMEARLKSLEEAVGSLKNRLEEKEKEIQALNDIEDIKRLQCAYGYYLERGMADEIIDCFADHPDVSATFVEGTYLGLKGVRRYFDRMRNMPPSFLHQVMQVSPIVTLSEDGKTAKGRWYGYGAVCSMPVNDTIDPMYMSVVYEMDYIKEDGIWKILKLAFLMHYAYTPPKPAGQMPDIKMPEGEAPGSADMGLSPDMWAEYDTQYPSGYIYPFHFKHPVTGKVTSEVDYNAKLNLKPNRFKPK